jgi:hypothetical protein
MKTRDKNLYFEVEVFCAKLGYLGSGDRGQLSVISGQWSVPGYRLWGADRPGGRLRQSGNAGSGLHGPIELSQTSLYSELTI